MREIVQGVIIGGMRKDASKRGEPMASDEHELLEKIRELPPDKLAEVEDFVDFLKTREDDRRWSQAAAKMSEEPFARVWDNPEDAAYDAL